MERGLTAVHALHTASTLARRPVGRPTIPQSTGLAQAHSMAASMRTLLVATVVAGGQVYPVEAHGGFHQDFQGGLHMAYPILLAILVSLGATVLAYSYQLVRSRTSGWRGERTFNSRS